MNEVQVLEKSMDYDKLVKEFGVSLIDTVIDKFDNPHYLIRRRHFFAHRDLDKILDGYKNGKKFAIVSGRGPSNPIHIGHLMIFKFVKWFQDAYGAEIYLPLSDDEKYVFGKIKDLNTAEYYAYDNALDMLALGFNPDKTHIFISSKYLPKYQHAIAISRYATFNTVKAVFGFKGETNPGAIFYPAIQAAHILLPTFDKGLPVLVPIAIDQDPYIRLTRDIAERLKVTKPAAIHSKFLRGLDGKPMSASNPETSIFTHDSNKEIKKKVWRALTGGRGTIEEQKKLGGEPEKCVVFEWLRLLFLAEDTELQRVYDECTSGKRICGDTKKELTKLLVDFLQEHRKKKLEVAKIIDKFFMHEINRDIVNQIAEQTEKEIEQYG